MPSLPSADGKAVHYIATVAARRVRRVDQLIEQRIVTAAADVLKVSFPPRPSNWLSPLLPVIAVVIVGAVNPFNIQQPRGTESGVLSLRGANQRLSQRWHYDNPPRPCRRYCSRCRSRNVTKAAGAVIGIGPILCDKGVVIPGTGNGSAVAAGGRFGGENITLLPLPASRPVQVTLSETPLVIFTISAE